MNFVDRRLVINFKINFSPLGQHLSQILSTLIISKHLNDKKTLMISKQQFRVPKLNSLPKIISKLIGTH